MCAIETDRKRFLTWTVGNQDDRDGQQGGADLLHQADNRVTSSPCAGVGGEVPAHQQQLRLLGTAEAAPYYQGSARTRRQAPRSCWRQL